MTDEKAPPPRQLSFDLPQTVSLAAEDYFVSEANRPAWAMVTGPAPWPEGKLALVGPEGAGKSHLVRLWQTATGAEVRTARALALQPGLPPPGGRLAVEDMDRLPPDAQTPLFHIHNHLAATGGSLLMTARTAPIRWPITLPDLASRLQATAVIRIEDPDDRLLHAILAKLFADRQIAAPPSLLDWLAQRIERSFAAARQIVEALDTAALDTGRPVSVALARTLLDKSGPDAG